MAIKSRRLNRKAVLEAAAELADAAGSVPAVTLAELAQRLEIRTPSLYNHVAGLDDLRYGLSVLAMERLVMHLRGAAAGLAGRAALEAMAAAYRQFAQCHPGIYPLTVIAPDPEQTELAAVAQELLEMLLLVMASMGLQGNDALHTIRGLRAIVHGFAALEAAEGYKLALDRDESFRRVLDAYLDGAVKRSNW